MMPLPIFHRVSMMTALLCSLTTGTGQAQARGSLTETQAKSLIETGTQLRACGTESVAFQTVQIGTPIKERQPPRVTVYPVHASYTISCRYGTEQMRGEVDLRTGFYVDEFGGWKEADTEYGGDQSWDTMQNDVRCRVQNIAHLTQDGNGKVTGSTPAKDQGYIGCTVMQKATD